MRAMEGSQTAEIQAPGLGRKIGLAWAALAWEGLWPRLVPLLAFVALFIAAAHLDPFAGHASKPATRGRDRDGGVPPGPLVAVQDRLAAGENDSMAAALWEAHRRRE